MSDNKDKYVFHTIDDVSDNELVYVKFTPEEAKQYINDFLMTNPKGSVEVYCHKETYAVEYKVKKL